MIMFVAWVLYRLLMRFLLELPFRLSMKGPGQRRVALMAATQPREPGEATFMNLAA